MNDRDVAKWVPASRGCSAPLSVAPFATVRRTVVSNGADTFTGTFRFRTGGAYFLCYRFMYREQEVPNRVPGTGWEEHREIRLVAVGIIGGTGGGASPNGTKASRDGGCVTNVTVTGQGLAALETLNYPPTLKCLFGSEETSVSYRTDSQIYCNTPAFTRTAVMPLTVRIQCAESQREGACNVPSLTLTALSNFFAYDDAGIRVDTVFPGGGAYNMQTDIYVSGRMLNYGRITCRFGGEGQGLLSSWGEYHNSTHIRCEKPRFPDAYRSRLGSFTLEVTPNGQCYAGSTGNFTTYNALVSGPTLRGAPATSSVALEVLGEGFVTGLTGGFCRFTQRRVPEGRRPTIVSTALSVSSTTRAVCSNPAAGLLDTSYTLALSLNGRTIEPNRFASIDVVFTEYDLSQVRVSAVIPPGAPVATETAVTIIGAGFAEYGAGQLKCSSNGELVSGVLLDSNRVLCSIPPIADANTASVTISLNNGTRGTFSQDNSPYEVYQQPRLTSITPTTGDANGGNTVTIQGTGFEALHRSFGIRGRAMRCSFGGEVRACRRRHSNAPGIVWGALRPPLLTDARPAVCAGEPHAADIPQRHARHLRHNVG